MDVSNNGATHLKANKPKNDKWRTNFGNVSSSKSNIQNLASKIQYDLPNQNNIDH